jgi:crossover junction endodeoxyribonuclease RusA
MTLEFSVYGVAQPMGSKRAFIPKGWTRPVLTDTNKSLKSWQVLVSEAASAALHRMPAADRTLLLDGVRLTIAFHFPRPVSLPKRTTVHTKKPDLDKVVRGIGDALSRIVFRDDSQIIDLIAMKRYAPPGKPPHVDIRVEPSAGVEPVEMPLFEVRR